MKSTLAPINALQLLLCPRYQGERLSTTKANLLKHFQHIGDRVPVNHVVARKLEASFSKDLNELNCNLHPLDGLAFSTRSTLKNLGTYSLTFW